MAFMRKVFRDDRPAGQSSRIATASSAIVRLVVAPCAGVALSLWLVAGMAGVYSASNSLSSSSSFMPSVPRALNAAIPVEAQKSPRLLAVADAHSGKISINERFEMVRARAALSPGKLAAAFQRSEMMFPKRDAAAALAPLRERFDVATARVSNTPKPIRFGQRSETERSSRLALALAGSAGIELAYATAASAPGSGTPFSRLFDGPEGMLDSDDDGDVALFDDLPDNMPLPARRPRVENSPADKPDKAPARRTVKAPAHPAAPKSPGRGRDSSSMLAYAKPDNPRDSGGGLFGNLFSSAPKARPGVAVYDISAAVVTMPDGTKLEAHSGIGHMADNVKYVDRRMKGPTPPGTYDLTMRESLFHGVEAIRLTPSDGKNPYGRNGLLAHTEMLRGRPEQSNGCVAFKDYKRFLKAFKRGRIKRMIVVPGRSRHSPPATTVADNGRGA